MATEVLDEPINYTREAFLHPVNLGLLVVAALGAFFLNDYGQVANLMLTMAFGLELVYLGTVPRLPRFRKMARLKRLRSRSKTLEDKALFQELDSRSQKRFLVLKHLAKLIKENFDKLPYSSQGLLDNIRNKINELLSNYLALLDLNQRYQKYMNAGFEDGLIQEIEQEEGNIDQIKSERLRETKTRRLAILKKRLKKYESAKEKYQICETHLETIEDAVRYIYEQSMTMSDPEEIGYQLDNLLLEVEETSELIEDLDRDILPIYDDLQNFKERSSKSIEVEESGQREEDEGEQKTARKVKE